jgi:hypothetical protein
MQQSRNDFLFDLFALMCSWLIMTFAAQYCLLADKFGNNLFFEMTNYITTYVMHIMHAKIAGSILGALIFPRNNVFYVGLRQMAQTHSDLFELIAIFNVTVVIIICL